MYRPGGWCGDDNWGFSFSFGYVSSDWAIGVGYSNWYDDCAYYRPVYSCYRPAWRAYNWCSPWYYGRPYYSRPYYSVRYNYGCYWPRYSYVAYTSPAYATYPWLYDSNEYEDAYDSGFARGYEAGTQGDVGHEPTWLAGGASSSAPSNQPLESGWDLLISGDAREARRAFDRERTNAPDDGLPNIGYAIAAGIMERYEEAVVVMRTAARDDPDAFNEAPRHSGIDDQMRVLLTHFRSTARERPDHADSMFMIAALRHLLSEHALAYVAIDQAIEAGDADDSARLLKAVIIRALDAETPVAPSDHAEPAQTTPSVLDRSADQPGTRQF